MRLRIEGWVRQLVLGERRDPYDVVASLASTLERTGEDGAQLGAVAEAITAALGLSYVRVEVDRSAGERLVASRGARPHEVRSFPVTYRTRPIGRITLPAHGMRNQLTARDEIVLADLVRQAAGRSNDALAAEPYVSNKTVRNTVSSIYGTLHASDRAEAIIRAREAGLGRDD